MRIFSIILWLFSASILFFSCGSLKNMNCEKAPFEELDSLQKTLSVANFEIEIPKNWKGAKRKGTAHYDLIDINAKKEKKIIAHLNIEHHKKRNECINKITIEDYLNYFMENKVRYRNTINEDFKHILLSSNHKKYGKIYIIKYAIRYDPNQKSKIEKYATFLYFYKNIGYTIEYNASFEDFETYLPLVEKSINSFKIIESESI